MRWLIRLVILFAVVYGGYWFIGRNTLNDRIAAALDQAGAQGVSVGTWGVRGFPNRFDTTFEDVEITTPNGLTWSAPWLQVFALAYRPNEVIAVWPDEQSFDMGGETLTLLTSGMRASARVRANADLVFAKAELDMHAPRLRLERDGTELSMSRLFAAARARPDTERDYDVYLDAQSITLPDWMRMALDPEGTQPSLIRDLRFDGTATLSRVLDRHLAEGDPVLLEALNIRELGLVWGEISISVIGQVSAGADGRAEGSLTISAANWERALDMARAAGLIGEGFEETYANMARQMDETPHLPETLTLTLTLSDGRARLGPLPIGPAPRLH